MKIENEVLRWSLIAVALAAVFGVLLPFLISADDTLLVLAGFAVLILTLFLLAKYTRKQFDKPKQTKPTNEVP